MLVAPYATPTRVILRFLDQKMRSRRYQSYTYSNLETSQSPNLATSETLNPHSSSYLSVPSLRSSKIFSDSTRDFRPFVCTRVLQYVLKRTKNGASIYNSGVGGWGLRSHNDGLRMLARIDSFLNHVASQVELRHIARQNILVLFFLKIPFSHRKHILPNSNWSDK
jgi:hypothetical protein